MTSLTSWSIQMEFSGSGAGWTSVQADVRANPSPAWSYGVMGNGPLDRIGGTGTLTFGLDNSTQNSGGKLGYYSPGHANCRSGFEMGIRCRLILTYGGTDYYKFIGTLVDIDPVPGQYRERVTLCQVVDWMDETTFKMPNVATQVSQRADQVIATILAAMTRPPVATSYAAAQLEMPYSLDTTKDESTPVMSELNKLVLTDMGYLYLKGNTSAGGVLTFEDRRARENPPASAATLNDTMVTMKPRRPRDLIYNTVKVIVHPRIVDPDASSVLYTLDTSNPPAIAAGETITIIGQYRDPDQRAQRVGGVNLAAPVATTDYTFGTGPGDGSLTANLSVTATSGGNSAIIQLQNTGAVTGYVTKLQIRGRGLYDYAPITYTTTDATSKATYGERVLTLDLPYESRTHVAKSLGDLYLSLYKDPHYFVDGVEFIGNRSATLMGYALSIEPGAVVTLTETVTGINTAYFVNGVSYRLEPGGILHTAWVLAPVLDTGSYWILGTSTLGVSTILGV